MAFVRELASIELVSSKYFEQGAVSEPSVKRFYDDLLVLQYVL
jgi:hypothetical protein